jgi:potassium-transporting ATPase KdpC subunit
MHSVITSLRITLVTIAVCVVGYTGVILGIAQLVAPNSANGSLIVGATGMLIGSGLIAQKFTEPGYFWPRPSAVDYNAAGAGGSNKSPTSTDLSERVVALVAQYGATSENPLPPELGAASGSGLDPHISEHAALYQVPRVANARQIDPAQLETLVRAHAFAPGRFLTSERVVNVLELNLALDSLALPR